MDIWTIIAAATGIVGVLLLVIAMVGDRARGRRRCPRCWYSMTGVPGLVCPECGRDAGHERRLLRRRRRWRLAAVGVIVMLAAAGWHGYRVAARDGAWSLVPFSVGMHVLPWYDAAPAGLSAQLRNRLNEGPIREWQRQHLYERTGVILEDPTKSKDAKMLALRLVEGVSWRGGYAGRATGEAGAAVPTLIAALDDGEPMVRKFSAGLVGTIGGDTDRALAAVVPLMDTDPDLEVRMEAVGSVGMLARTPAAATHPEIMDRLRRAYAGGDAAMKTWCIDTAGKLGPVRPAAITWLAEVLGSDQPWIVVAACKALRKAGPAAAAAGETLVRVAVGDDRVSAVEACAALAAAGARTETAHDEMLAAVRKHAGAAEVFGAFEELFRERTGASEELIEAVSGWTTSQSAFAAAYACDRGADPAKFLVLFERQIRTGTIIKTEMSLWGGVYKWAFIGPTRDTTLLEFLGPAAQPQNGLEVWRTALRGRLTGDDAGTVSALLGVISTGKPAMTPWTHGSAAEALGYFGEAARPALPALQELMKEEAWEPRVRAREAIGRITGTTPPDPTSSPKR